MQGWLLLTFLICLHNQLSSFNPQAAKQVCLRFSSIVWFLQFLSHYLWILETRSKLPASFLRFQTEEGVLRVNKSQITGENTFNGDHFEIEGNHGSSKYEKTLFWVFLQICDQCFNPQTAKYVSLRFSSIVWFLQFLSHFLRILEARSKLILFYTKF